LLVFPVNSREQPVPDGSLPNPRAAPLFGPFGAEITDFDARRLTSAASLLDLLHRHQVLVLRDQRFSPGDYVAFSRLFGELQPQVLDRFTHPEAREIYVLSNVIENGEPIGNSNDGFTWHTDQSTRTTPTAITMLYGLETPPHGAATHFASTYLAYEAMPSDERARLDPLKVIFSHERLHDAQRAALAAAGAADDHKSLSHEEREALRRNAAVHPLVRTHPATGRRGLYLGTLSCAGIEGLDQPEGLALMDHLVAYATQERFVYAHEWRQGDVVLWDNRGLLHMATAYDKARYRRVMWRTSVEGERPF
jgi:taurine dioxygenase